jgi:hydrogenase-1 operon protein HyaE
MTEQQFPHPLLARLVQELSYPLISNQADLEAFIHRPGHQVLFCGGDTKLYPECLDVAVILPELDKAMQGTVDFAICARETDELMKMRYGFTVWPSLVFLKGGDYVGAISGMKDWVIYLEKFAELLNSPTSRPPSVGIAVTAASAISCH